MSQIISALLEISSRYDALFVDLWGCVHNGVHALPEAVAALQAYRKTGGKVVLVTNSPRPRAGVTKQLVGFGVPDDAWDTIATSGDSARSAMFRGVVGQKVHLIGYPGDERFFDEFRVLQNVFAHDVFDLCFVSRVDLFLSTSWREQERKCSGCRKKIAVHRFGSRVSVRS